jgi:hypothetical protein
VVSEEPLDGGDRAAEVVPCGAVRSVWGGGWWAGCTGRLCERAPDAVRLGWIGAGIVADVGGRMN